MATPVESSPGGKDPKGFSGVDESQLEKSLIRRGLATAAEIEACKSKRTQMVAKEKEGSKNLLEIMVEAKVLTRSQMVRLLQEGAGESSKKFQIPGYQVISKIGKGSMGVVYKAKQLSVDRIVAIKILLDSLAQNKEFIKRFEREAKIAARLSHNNIVNAIDAGETDGHYFFVMEYVEGPTIKDYLDKHKTFDEKESLQIVLAVAEALKHAHTRGLIHRDIKPENIILTRDAVKLADLGLARITDDEKWGLSEAGMAIGTPYYISPEQVRGQTNIDIRADIYSLGATLYHMVTGRVPYGGETPNEVMRKHVDTKVAIVPPDHLNTNLSGGLGMVVETMMAKNREHRYQSPDDMILDLKCLMRDESPMIAGQKLDALAALAEGETDANAPMSEVTDEQMAEMASYVNSRNVIIAAMAMILFVSVITNVILVVAH
jgi:eukaryotic-like serine/threonine-protein kinase